MAIFTLPRLAVGASIIFVSGVGYGSQLLFKYIEPGPLQGHDFWYFNGIVGCLFFTYARSCLVNPGDFRTLTATQIAKAQAKFAPPGANASERARDESRWCKKCDAYKPPRAHHCKVCKRCIPKMDHHCPWTINCVSYTTFPHFMRFLFFSVASVAKLMQLHFVRVSIIWKARHLPSYLGPSTSHLCALFVLVTLNVLAFFAMGVIFLRTVYSLATNTTAIESWEIERHHTLVRRARKRGGVLDGPNGTKIHVTKQEFPYDIGVWSNICQGMGGGPLVWFWIFARTPSLEGSLSFEVNDFESKETTWPPFDPDKAPRKNVEVDYAEVALELDEGLTDEDRIKAFKERQAADMRRRHRNEAWKDLEGQTLDDFGVDDDDYVNTSTEEDDVPIGVLLARKKEA